MRWRCKLTPPADARFTKELAAELQEPKVPLLRRAVTLLGVTLATQLLGEVVAVEHAGGQMTTAGDRKRTAGGVWWSLLKARNLTQVKS